MIEVYSNNVSVPAGATVPLDNEVLRKGCTATKSGNTINLNRCGVYQVNCECSASAAGTLQLQNAVAGVVRYPSASTYYAGNNPFCNCGGCGCGM